MLYSSQMTKLSATEGIILYKLQFDAERAAPLLSKQIKVPTHTIHYHLNRLREAQVIRPWAHLNVALLGYEQFRIYFTLASEKRPVRTKVLETIKRDKHVVWSASLGGAYQYALSVYVRSGRELTKFLDDLVDRFGSVFLKKAVVLDTEFILFKKKYLVARKDRDASEVLSTPELLSKPKLDAIDYKILSALSHRELSSHRDLARFLGMPRATVDLRIKKLRDDKIILGSIFHISATKLGFQVFRLLIFARGAQKGLQDKLRKFCAVHPNIVNLSYCIGVWDYEATVEVAESKDIALVIEDLFSELGSFLTDVEVVPVFEQSATSNLELTER